MSDLRTLVNGQVRPSSDDLGVGLYSRDETYRYWFLTEVDPGLRPGTPEQAHRNGYPVVDHETLVWVGLNPSRSDDNGRPRPTLATVLAWATPAPISGEYLASTSTATG